MSLLNTLGLRGSEPDPEPDPETIPEEEREIGEDMLQDVLDDVFTLLANERRRLVVATLHMLDEDEWIGESELAERISAIEHGCTPQELTSSQRKRTYVSLYQTHLHQLEAAGLVYRAHRSVRAGPTAEAFFEIIADSQETIEAIDREFGDDDGQVSAADLEDLAEDEEVDRDG